MKQVLLYTFTALLIVSSYACNDDEGDNAPISPISVVEMPFVATYDGAPLVMTDAYDYANNLPVLFTRLKFYISNVSLLSTDGSRLELSEIEALDFTTTNIDTETATQGINLTFLDIPVGEYTGLSFGVGVAADLNETKPSDYSSSHPLSDASDYWGAWGSYIFTKIEGKLDVDQDGSYTLGVSYHIGSDDLYRDISFTKPITITEGNTTLPQVEVDLKKILVRSETDFLDMETNDAVHNDRDLMNYLMDNFDAAVSLN